MFIASARLMIQAPEERNVQGAAPPELVARGGRQAINISP
jgi:hypothetical protein